MEKRNKLILGLILITSLSSCGVFKSVFKSKEKFKENTEIKIDKEDSKVIEDKSTTIIVEKKDTNILVPSKTIVSLSKPISNLSDIVNLTLVSDGLYTVRQSYDSLSKSLKTTLDIKEQNIPFKYDKKITINNDIKTSSNSKDNSIYKKDTKLKVETKQKEPKNIFWFVVLGIGVVAVFSYFTYTYFKNRL